ncbi:RNA-binding S4 domain-containing protein [Pedococcus sp. 5OH_020]|uniref:RNA-binding S4 domain-containing protein n=1 Tax=Pedococcus sp. 5OH_020 TaxID=2989814 RepID=UPI0022E9AF37|nr:RNA-binding S4 domain-containing protein [Pedococcus sp. 5OH_020]
MTEVEDVPIRDDAIRLGQLLKLAGLVDDGAAARVAIESGQVSVDGDVVVRRGSQVRPGQVVAYAGRAVRVTGSP